MLMPERSGFKTDGGWSVGNEQVNGTSVNQTLTVNDRDLNTPDEYKASKWIELTDGFESGAADEFVAYIADGSNTTAGNTNGSGGENNSYRYGFNGKENDDEIQGIGNVYDYGFRIYNSRLGRFLSVDPLQKEFPWNSPYTYAENDVVRCVDIDGLEKYVVTNFRDANGKITKTVIFTLKSKETGQSEELEMESTSGRLRTTEDILIRDVWPNGRTTHHGAKTFDSWQKNVLRHGTANTYTASDDIDPFTVYVGKAPDGKKTYLGGVYSESRGEFTKGEYFLDERGKGVTTLVGTPEAIQPIKVTEAFVGVGTNNIDKLPDGQGILVEGKFAPKEKVLSEIRAMAAKIINDPNVRSVIIKVPGTMNSKMSTADERYRNFKAGLERIAAAVMKIMTSVGVDPKLLKVHTPIDLNSTGDGGHSDATIQAQ